MSRMTSREGATRQVRVMAEAARWAPSVHNTQPWLFRALPAGLAILGDSTRGLPVLDPTGRLLALSCGAAVCNAEVALAASGYEPRVVLLPDSPETGTFATVTVGDPRTPSEHDMHLADAVRHRRTHRRTHGRKPPDEKVLVDLAESVQAAGAQLCVADDGARHRLAGLLITAIREQASTPGLVDETESWIRHWGTGAPAEDGILIESLGTAQYPVDSLVQDPTDVGAVHPGEVEAALSASTVVAISTSGDELRDWLSAGRALERLWLHATAAGLVLTFTDQATQQPSTRPQLTEVFDAEGAVQVVVRIGTPLVDVPPTRRRWLEELIS